jgi:hypothetical protein
MDEIKFRLIRELYRREEMYGFTIFDIFIALFFSLSAWLFLSIIPLAGGVLLIFLFRNFRMNKPRGYFLHLLYHYGYFNPGRTIPPGSKICKTLYE